MKMSRRLLFVGLLAALCASSCSFHNTALTANPVATTETVDPIFQKALSEIERSPDSPMGYVNLAMLYMKESRKTGEFALNAKAAAAIARALEMDPANIPARKLEASLHLSNHRFAEAIDAAKNLQQEVPEDSFVYGILADAYIEIGSYERAIESAQKMVDLRPGTAAYSRVAQIRSLHGDHKGAVEMFTLAARSADPNDKETQSWCLVQLGDEHWKNGNYVSAENAYDEALANYPDYFLAVVSKGRVRVSLGDFATAEKLLTDVQLKGPIANAIHLLGDIYTIRGQTEKANAQYEQFQVIQEKLGDAADHKSLVTLLADRGKIEAALEMAEQEYTSEKSIHSADLLAWSLYKAGRSKEATKYIREAMRLGTKDAKLYYHAGMIAKANGEQREAKRLLEYALKLNLGFDIVQANEAKNALNAIGRS